MVTQNSPFIPQRDLEVYHDWASDVLHLVSSPVSDLHIKLHIGSLLDRHPQWIEALLFDYPHIQKYIELID